MLLRFDAWRRLDSAVLASLLALLNGLAASDERAARECGLPQRLLDAARRHFVRQARIIEARAAPVPLVADGASVSSRESSLSVGGSVSIDTVVGGGGRESGAFDMMKASYRKESREAVVPAEALHAQCLSTAALLASDRLACQGSRPYKPRTHAPP